MDPVSVISWLFAEVTEAEKQQSVVNANQLPRSLNYTSKQVLKTSW